MPTPVGHTLAGIFASRFSKTRQPRELLFQTMLCITMSNFPDLDLLPGLLFRSALSQSALSSQPALGHEGITHSLGFALVASLAAAVVYRAVNGRRKNYWGVFFLALLAYSTHLALDMLQPDGLAPYGIPLLWPLSVRTYLSPVPVFLGVVHTGGKAASVLDFARGVLVWHNLAAILVEVLILAPLVGLAQLWRRWRLDGKQGNRGVGE